MLYRWFKCKLKPPKNCKKKHSEDNKKETYTGNDTYKDNMDDVQLVNSDKDAKGLTSENLAATPTPTLNRRRTHSARSNDGDPSRKKSSQNKQTDEESMKGNEYDDAKGLTSEKSAATPTPTPPLNRMRTCSSKSNDGDLSRKTSSQNRQPEEESTKGNEDDDDVFQC